MCSLAGPHVVLRWAAGVIHFYVNFTMLGHGRPHDSPVTVKSPPPIRLGIGRLDTQLPATADPADFTEIPLDVWCQELKKTPSNVARHTVPIQQFSMRIMPERVVRRATMLHLGRCNMAVLAPDANNTGRGG